MFSTIATHPASIPAARSVSRAAAASTPVPIVNVVDADAGVREFLRNLIDAAGWRPALFASAAEFLARSRVAACSCVVLNVRRGDVESDLEKLIVEERARSSIIFTAGPDGIPMQIQALTAGEVTILTKPLVDSTVLDALRGALEQSRALIALEVEVRRLRMRHAALSSREREVMALAGAGQLNKQIGEALRINEASVKAYRVGVMRKMAAVSPADLVKMAGLLASAHDLA